jgi:hypothetical protein
MVMTLHRHFQRNDGLNLILGRQTSRFNYGSNVPAVTMAAFITIPDFIGFLRCREFTILNQLDLEYNLCLNDLQITDRCAFRQGIRILLDKTGYASCPVFR